MDLSERERKTLTIIFKIAYSQLEILESHKCDVTNWGDSDYDRNTIYNLAEKLGIEI